jgi:hypothetical protein
MVSGQLDEGLQPLLVQQHMQQHGGRRCPPQSRQFDTTAHQFLLDANRALLHDATVLIEQHATRFSLEQNDAQLIFQRLHRTGDGGLRAKQVVRASRHAAAGGNGREHVQIAQIG